MDADVRSMLEEFGAAVCATDLDAANGSLTADFRSKLGPDGLERLLEAGLVPDATPPFAVLSIDWNSSALADLRDPSALFDDRPTKPQSVRDFIDNGPSDTNILSIPRFVISDAITDDAFRIWAHVMFEPDPEDNPEDLDFCLEIWCIVVDDDGVPRVAHIELPE